jgi:hypothetical protein
LGESLPSQTAPPPFVAMKSVESPPKASVLIESMRDIGYSLDTALADIIDNSISAGARTIQVLVDSASNDVRLGVLDDGKSMDRQELLDAMRLGSRHPHETRPRHDLGRFGLGLKTASFSQCRRLSVVARRRNKTAAAIWDLDHVAATDRWSLITPETTDEVPFADKLDGDGVLVVWEKIDRAIEGDGSETARKHFQKLIDGACQHLELVFHRYLSGEPGTQRVAILINGIPLKPFDPFNSSHPATQKGMTETVQIGSQKVEITAFTLPHHRNVSRAEYDHYGGPAGYMKMQGFYLYREKRLIVHGTWFGLARQQELTKLARVRIDMPNSLDSLWHVDVKKAWARPPLHIRTRLQTLVGELGAPSRRVFTQRGQRLHHSRIALWSRVQLDNQIVYRLNIESPMLAEFRKRLNLHDLAEFDQLVETISAGVPLDAIFADLAGSPEALQMHRIAEATLRNVVERTVAQLRVQDLDWELVAQMLHVAEPFRSNWEQTEAILEELRKE